jgi:hypothetical protein
VKFQLELPIYKPRGEVWNGSRKWWKNNDFSGGYYSRITKSVHLSLK